MIEKLPLLLLAAIFSGVTFWTQADARVVNETLPLPWRIGNALVSYVAYLGQWFYPLALAVLYPRRGLDLPLWKIFGAGLVLVGVTAAVLLARRRSPYLLVGWLWYLVMLLPVIGLVQFGIQAEADRFTYLPQIGLCIALVWEAADACRSWPYRRWFCATVSALVLLVLMGCAWRQTCYWRNSETLWRHTLACTTGNSIAHYHLGIDLAHRGRIDEAIAHYQKALEIKPDFADAHNNLGVALARRGQVDSAIVRYQKALEIKPDCVDARNNLGAALARRGQVDSAIACFEKALEIKADCVDAHNNLGIALADRGQIDKAIAHYHKALEIKPDYAEARYNLGIALARRGNLDEAMACFRKALEIQPDYADARYNLGIALARRGNLDEAMTCFRKALEIQPNHADARYNLGLALAHCGQFDEAIAQLQKAVEIKPDYAKAHKNLGVALTSRGQIDKAIAHYHKALEIKPDYTEVHNNLAWLQATCSAATLRNGAEAVAHARRADQLCGGRQPEVLDTLAAAYAEAGRFPEALATVRKALELAQQQNNKALADTLRARMALYEAGKPYRQTPLPSTPALSKP